MEFSEEVKKAAIDWYLKDCLKNALRSGETTIEKQGEYMQNLQQDIFNDRNKNSRIENVCGMYMRRVENGANAPEFNSFISKIEEENRNKLRQGRGRGIGRGYVSDSN